MLEAYSLINSFSVSPLSFHFLLMFLSFPNYPVLSLPSPMSHFPISSFLIFLIYPPHLHSPFPTLFLLSFSTSLITLHLLPLSHLLYFSPSCVLLFPLYSHLLILIEPLQCWGFYLPKHKDAKIKKNTLKPCHVGTHWKSLAENSQMIRWVPICQGFSHFSNFCIILYWQN